MNSVSVSCAVSLLPFSSELLVYTHVEWWAQTGDREFELGVFDMWGKDCHSDAISIGVVDTVNGLV